MTDQELIRHLDAIAFEDGPTTESKLERIQSILYQVDQANTANSIRADEPTIEERELYNGFRK